MCFNTGSIYIYVIRLLIRKNYYLIKHVKVIEYKKFKSIAIILRLYQNIYKFEKKMVISVAVLCSHEDKIL